MMVLTAVGGYAYRRKDGVFVVPISCLKQRPNILGYDSKMSKKISGYDSKMSKKILGYDSFLFKIHCQSKNYS